MATQYAIRVQGIFLSDDLKTAERFEDSGAPFKSFSFACIGIGAITNSCYRQSALINKRGRDARVIELKYQISPLSLPPHLTFSLSIILCFNCTHSESQSY